MVCIFPTTSCEDRHNCTKQGCCECKYQMTPKQFSGGASLFPFICNYNPPRHAHCQLRVLSHFIVDISFYKSSLFHVCNLVPSSVNLPACIVQDPCCCLDHVMVLLTASPLTRSNKLKILLASLLYHFIAHWASSAQKTRDASHVRFSHCRQLFVLHVKKNSKWLVAFNILFIH